MANAPEATTEEPKKRKTAPRKSIKKSPLILAHWKGFRSFDDAKSFVNQLAAYHGERKLLLALPFHHLEQLSSEMFGSSISVGSTSMASVKKDSFTEPVAADLIKDAGGDFVLIGDSDARQYLHEDEDQILAKLRKCLAEGLPPMLGIGETILEHHEGSTENVLRKQIESALSDLTAKQQAAVTLVYDTCWGMRYQEDCTAAKFESTYKMIRSILEEVIGAAGKKVKVLLALPPYLDDLSQIPSAKVDGFYMAKASVIPEALTTIATPEMFVELPGAREAFVQAKAEQAAGGTKSTKRAKAKKPAKVKKPHKIDDLTGYYN